jgi:hypothetical protein
MASLIYRGTSTGQNAQAWFADDGSKNGEQSYESTKYLACQRVHLINPNTGKMLGPAEK